MYYPATSLSRKDQSMLNRARQVAKTSTCKTMHGAVIVKGGRVISVGVNSYRNHPLTVTTPSSESSTHAEIAAMKACNTDLRGCIIYIARVNRKGEDRMSMPCVECNKAIIKAGFKKIVYTNW